MPPIIAAPKLALPSHAESYNPSEEYLLNEVTGATLFPSLFFLFLECKFDEGGGHLHKIWLG